MTFPLFREVRLLERVESIDQRSSGPFSSRRGWAEPGTMGVIVEVYDDPAGEVAYEIEIFENGATVALATARESQLELLPEGPISRDIQRR